MRFADDLQFRALMRLHHQLIACLLAVTWLSAAWHDGLEAVGWMIDHVHPHQHAHPSDNAADGSHAPATGEHEPVFARSPSHEGALASAPALVLLLLVTLAALLGQALLQQQRKSAADPWIILRRCRDFPLSSWQFLWRCAPPSAAPPVLG